MSSDKARIEALRGRLKSTKTTATVVMVIVTVDNKFYRINQVPFYREQVYETQLIEYDLHHSLV